MPVPTRVGAIRQRSIAGHGCQGRERHIETDVLGDRKTHRRQLSTRSRSKSCAKSVPPRRNSDTRSRCEPRRASVASQTRPGVVRSATEGTRRASQGRWRGPRHGSRDEKRESVCRQEGTRARHARGRCPAATPSRPRARPPSADTRNNGYPSCRRTGSRSRVTSCRRRTPPDRGNVADRLHLLAVDARSFFNRPSSHERE